jgi:hypothetical protein
MRHPRVEGCERRRSARRTLEAQLGMFSLVETPRCALNAGCPRVILPRSCYRLSSEQESSFSRLVLRGLCIERRDKRLCGRRNVRLMCNYNILRRDFLAVDSLVSVVVRSDGRTLKRNACK